MSFETLNNFVMQTFAYASIYVCLVFMCNAQGKHYKNQINRTLKEKVTVEIFVEEKINKPSMQTPKYQHREPNVIWVDTSKKKKNSHSYKQHGGRSN